MQPARPRLGQLLVDARILSEAQLEQVLAAQKADGRKLGAMLVDHGFITETQLTQVLSQQLSVPWVSLYHIDFSRELLSLVPKNVAEKYCLVPIYVRAVRGQGDTLYVAMEDPMNEDALRACSEHAGLPARAMIAAPSAIRKAVQLYYGAAPRASGAPAVKAPSAPSAASASPPVITPSFPTASTQVASVPSDFDDRPTPVLGELAPVSPSASAEPVVAPFMVDEPSSGQARHVITDNESPTPPKQGSRRDSDSPIVEVKEVDLSKARAKRKGVQVTLLDGTTIKLPSVQKKRGAARTDPPSPEDKLTAADLLAALRAAAHGVDTTEVLGENVRWEKMMAALLSLLMRKHLILEKELIEELKKI